MIDSRPPAPYLQQIYLLLATRKMSLSQKTQLVERFQSIRPEYAILRRQRKWLIYECIERAGWTWEAEGLCKSERMLGDLEGYGEFDARKYYSVSVMTFSKKVKKYERSHL